MLPLRGWLWRAGRVTGNKTIATSKAVRIRIRIGIFLRPPWFWFPSLRAPPWTATEGPAALPPWQPVCFWVLGWHSPATPSCRRIFVFRAPWWYWAPFPLPFWPCSSAPWRVCWDGAASIGFNCSKGGLCTYAIVRPLIKAQNPSKLPTAPTRRPNGRWE